MICWSFCFYFYKCNCPWITFSKFWLPNLSHSVTKQIISYKFDRSLSKIWLYLLPVARKTLFISHVSGEFSCFLSSESGREIFTMPMGNQKGRKKKKILNRSKRSVNKFLCFLLSKFLYPEVALKDDPTIPVWQKTEVESGSETNSHRCLCGSPELKSKKRASFKLIE